MQTEINEVRVSRSQLSALREDLNLDIARVTVSCAQAKDDGLMAELSDTIPDDHPFKDCVRYLWFSMNQERVARLEGQEEVQSETAARSPDSNKSAVYDLREDVADFVRDLSSVGTFDLERESDSRLTAFEVALKYVSGDKIADLIKDLSSIVEESPNVFTAMDDDLISQLNELKVSAGIKSGQ